MKRVLFICLGNICRSPAAEAVMKHRLRDSALEHAFEIDSAGILDAHQGEPADARMRAHAARRGIELTSISRPVTRDDFIDFDHLVAMDHQNVRDLHALAPDEPARQKVTLLLDAVPDTPLREVPDPYYGGAAGFEHVLDLVERACTALLDTWESEAT